MSPLFTLYADLIQPLANIDMLHALDDEPASASNEYINVATTADYTFYFKPK